MTDIKKIALTFDDGPTKETTQSLLNTLKQFDIKATWMLWGEHVKNEPELALAIADAGHEIGNHTYTHPDLSKLTSQQINEEISKTDRIIKEVLNGIEATFIRPPYGTYNENVIDTINRPLITWSIDSQDWDKKDATIIRNNILGNVHDGDIILMHDWVPATEMVLADIVSSLKNDGFEFVTVSALLGDKIKNAKVVKSFNEIEY
jgi:peptidoglycan/xylan/chitin deacetylase (PgdA/CDA1 family)